MGGKVCKFYMVTTTMQITFSYRRLDHNNQQFGPQQPTIIQSYYFFVSSA